MRLFAGHYCYSNLQLKKSYYGCLLFFSNCKFVIYTILLLKLLFCKELYAFEFLPYLCQPWTVMHCFRVLNADVYNPLYLLNGYFVAGFNLFLHRFQIFYYRAFLLCNIYILSAHKGPICYYSCSTYIYSKLGPAPVFGFVQLTRRYILVI